MLDRDRPAQLLHLLDAIRPLDSREPALGSRHHLTEIAHHAFPCLHESRGKPIAMVKVALKSAAMSGMDLCSCKLFDRFTGDASAQAFPRRAAQAAAPRARAQPEPDGERARHLR